MAIRKTEVDAVAIVRMRYTIDLDSDSYSMYDTIEEAMKADQQSFEEDLSLLLDPGTTIVSVSMVPPR